MCCLQIFYSTQSYAHNICNYNKFKLPFRFIHTVYILALIPFVCIRYITNRHRGFIVSVFYDNSVFRGTLNWKERINNVMNGGACFFMFKWNFNLNFCDLKEIKAWNHIGSRLKVNFIVKILVLIWLKYSVQ